MSDEAASLDAVDAENMLDHLLQGIDGTVADADDDTNKVLKDMSAACGDFNRSILQEMKDRKYRFHVTRLLHKHVQGGEIDKDKDFVSDDNDLAVLFIVDDKCVPLWPHVHAFSHLPTLTHPPQKSLGSREC